LATRRASEPDLALVKSRSVVRRRNQDREQHPACGADELGTTPEETSEIGFVY